MIATGTTTIAVETPRGLPARLVVRDDTTDLSTVGSTFRLWGKLDDEYDLASLTMDDGVLIDVGAHIGTVAIAFLLDNPGAKAVCVEPLPENIDLIAENADRNGVSQRLWLMPGAVGATEVRYGPDVHRFIGDIRGADGPVITVAKVDLAMMLAEAEDHFAAPVLALKTDCEGGEWSLLDSPDVGGIPLIFGEYHTRGSIYLTALLASTHDVTILSDDGGTGLFRAVRR